jgi:hypothetical protein
VGKRSSFERRPQDAYDTPYEAVKPLLPHLGEGAKFIEPCAGRGDLIAHLTKHGHHCVDSWDIEPRMAGLPQHDALTWRSRRTRIACCFITNPPWTREILHPLIVHLSDQRPTWLLFDADWAYTKQSAPYMPRCRAIVPVGRVKWIAGSKHTGKDNAAWYLFDATQDSGTQFFSRAA